MVRTAAVIVFAAAFSLGILPAKPALASSEDAWLHIRVVESGEDGEKVSVNLPLNLIEQILPHIKSGDGSLTEGRVRIGSTDLDGTDVRAILKAVANTKDGEFITVDGTHESVRVYKKGGHMHIDVNDPDEKVKVRIPFSVLDAMTADTTDDELNILAAVKALAECGEKELITVEEKNSHIRIWVDGKSGSD